jgi:hypothetical protein
MKNKHTTDSERKEFAEPYGEIPKRLKDYYESIQEEAIPDRFLDLLDKLAQAEQAQASPPAKALEAPVEESK